MKRRYGRSRWPEATAVVGMFVLVVVVMIGNWGEERGVDPVRDETPAPDREIAGRVVGNGEPIAGVALALYEADFGPVAEAVSAEDGSFSMRWIPRTTADARKLVLVGTDRDARFARSVARPTGEFELRPAVEVSGRVLRPNGQHVAGATVAVAVLGRHFGSTTSAADGTFSISGLPHGAPMEVFVCGAGVAPRTLRGFRVGEQLFLHVVAGRAVRVRVRDPDGNVVAGSVVRPAVSTAFRDDAPTFAVPASGVVVLPHAAANGTALVEASAEGYLPVFIDAPTHGQVEAVLWPSRSVALRLWDTLHRRGVVGAEVEVSLGTEDSVGDTVDNRVARWNGPDAARSYREYQLVAQGQRGKYQILLPRCAVTLSLLADAYPDREVSLAPGRTDALVRVRPLRRGQVATLVVRSTRFLGALWLVIADEDEQWYSAFLMRDGEGRVRVPVNRPLKLASAGAQDGFWLPKVGVTPIRAGRKRVVEELPLLADAAELSVRIEPPIAAVVTVVDKKFGKAVPPQRTQTTDEAKFWVRPGRKVTVTVEPEGNFREEVGEFEVGTPRSEWTAYIQQASGFRMRLIDAEGQPIPFAPAFVWEAARGGRLELRARAREVRSDALGVLRVVGLRHGPTPIEVRSPGFRTRRIPGPSLVDGTVKDLGTVTLAAAPELRGRVLDADGKPLGGVRVRTLARGLRRLDLPGGGARDLYDLVGDEFSASISDDSGYFVVRDATPRLPLLVAEAPGRYDLARAIVVVPADLVGDLTVRMPRAAHIGLALPMAADGVYMLISQTRAVRLHAHGALSLNPMPLTLPAGRVELYVRLRNGRWSAPILELKPGEHRVKLDDFGPR